MRYLNADFIKKCSGGLGLRGGGGYSLIWVVRVRATGQGMFFLAFFGLAVLNRVYNLSCLCPKQV